METFGTPWNTLFLLLLLGFFFSSSASGSPIPIVPIREGASAFKISLFADLHFGEDSWTDWGPLQDVKSINVINSVLDHESPDFVIYLGDVITANNIMIGNASLYFDQATSPPRNRGIPWATIFGNHDDAPFEWPLDWFSSPGIPPILCPQTTASNSDFVIYLGDVITANNIMIGNASLYFDQATSPPRNRGIPWATIFGNHDDAPFEWPLDWFSSPGIPPILCPQTTASNSGEDECSFRGTGRLELMKNEIKHKASLSSYGPRNLWPSVSNYVIQVSSPDSQSPVAFLYFLDSGGGSYPEVISSGQAEWFQQKAEQLNADSRVPEIIFWHIPSKAYTVVAPKLGIQKPCVGSINKESVADQEAENGILDLLVNRTSVKAIFVGHNHGLDWCCPYKTLWLCYARHTGYGGYGDWPRGSRILEFTLKPFSLRSWIRMEDGSVHSEVVLS